MIDLDANRGAGCRETQFWTERRPTLVSGARVRGGARAQVPASAPWACWVSPVWCQLEHGTRQPVGGRGTVEVRRSRDSASSGRNHVPLGSTVASGDVSGVDVREFVREWKSRLFLKYVGLVDRCGGVSECPRAALRCAASCAVPGPIEDVDDAMPRASLVRQACDIEGGAVVLLWRDPRCDASGYLRVVFAIGPSV